MLTRRVVWLLLPLVLAGCGGGTPKATLSVNCGDGTVLNGASSVDVSNDPAKGNVTLTYPDPANNGQIGTIPVPAHDQCKVVPVSGSGS